MFPSHKRLAAGIILVALLVSPGCATKLAKSFASINALRDALIRKYHDDVVLKVQNSNFLLITFVNSPLNQDSSAKRGQRAQETARFATSNYQDIHSIQQIWISFVESQTRFIVFTYSRGIESYGFDRNGAPFSTRPIDSFRTSETITSSDDPRAPVVRFSESTNQTDISITRIQLEGDMVRGIAMVPHFVVSGDARQRAAAVTPPESVPLDFASYSEAPVFSGDTNFEIFCDDRLAAKGFARLLPSAAGGSQEEVAQFLATRVSFGIFRKMASAQKVAIVLGNKRFELNEADINALSEMAGYVGNK
jgi:hypothetical protein